jgi:hypothetical protein
MKRHIETFLYAFRINTFITASMILFINGAIGVSLLAPYVFKQEGLVLSAAIISGAYLATKIAALLSVLLDGYGFKKMSWLFVVSEVLYVAITPFLLLGHIELYIYSLVIIRMVSTVVMGNFDLEYDKKVMLHLNNTDQYTKLQRSERTIFIVNGLVASVIGAVLYTLMEVGLFVTQDGLIIAAVIYRTASTLYSIWWFKVFVDIKGPKQLSFDF